MKDKTFLFKTSFEIQSSSISIEWRFEIVFQPLIIYIPNLSMSDAFSHLDINSIIYI